MGRGQLGRPALALIVTVLLAVGAAQTTSEQLQQLQQQLQQQKQLDQQQAQQLAQLRQNLAALGQQQRQTLARIDVLAGGVARLEAQAQELGGRIQGVQGQIAALDLQVQATSARVERLKLSARELMNALYRERSGRYVELLSQAKSLSDLVIRARYANLLGQQNTRVVEDLKTETARLNEQKRQQVAYRDQLAGLQKQLQAKADDLTRRRGQQQALLSELRRNQAGQQALQVQTQAQRAITNQNINGLVNGIVQEQARLAEERRRKAEEERRRREAEQRRIREEQARLARERARLEALASERRARAAAQRRAEAQRAQVQREQAALAAQQQTLDDQTQQAQTEAAPLPAVGNFSFPLPGGRVTSPYGIGGPWVVISGADGTTAVAAADGVVQATASYANTGWVVILLHGSGTLTVYSGLSALAVQQGQRVARGQALGPVGGSPLYGPGGLQFQVNQAGQYVAPRF